ncbi:MAG: cytochrome P450 [Marinibacterium sp.]
MPAAIDEVIRLRPTTTWATREALQEVSLDGVRFLPGDIVHVFVHASATDPATGYDGRFDIRARRKPHFGFGGGAHHCLGHFVARTDMAAALTVWLERWSSIRLAGSPRFLPDSGNTSPLELAVRPVWIG